MNEHGEPLGFDDHERAYQNAAPTNGKPSEASTVTPEWPEPLEPAAFHGIAGEFVRLIEPHSEGDPAALLLQFLVAFGNRVGRNPYFMVEETKHFMNLFACLVGSTAKARKGTSWNHIENAFLSMESGRDGFLSGLSSGEGLVPAVRDGDGDKDQGVTDKRLMVTQGEFCSVLKVMDREGNILSGIMRDAWDKGYLRVMTKKPMKATGAHISIIGHITIEELRRSLTETDKANGFANRFMWLCVKRSKCLPEGGDVPVKELAVLTEKIQARLVAAQGKDRLSRDAQAKEMWKQVYAPLSESEPGLIGSILSRSDPIVLRLSCIYALTDGSSTIRREHLAAALALWKYCDASARFIFGDSLGDPVADAILEAIRSAGAGGLTRTEISGLFKRHKTATQIEIALTALQQRGLIDRRMEFTEGRSAEVWYAKEAK